MLPIETMLLNIRNEICKALEAMAETPPVTRMSGPEALLYVAEELEAMVVRPHEEADRKG